MASGHNLVDFTNIIDMCWPARTGMDDAVTPLQRHYTARVIPAWKIQEK